MRKGIVFMLGFASGVAAVGWVISKYSAGIAWYRKGGQRPPDLKAEINEREFARILREVTT